MIFFTSDLHLGHEGILKYCHRPFAGVEEMNSTLIRNYNAVVNKVLFMFHNMLLSRLHIIF